MKKNNKNDNTLIKRKRLIMEMKKQGIHRINRAAILLLEKYFKENLDKVIRALNEEMVIQGRKTLKKNDVKKVLAKREDSLWEI